MKQNEIKFVTLSFKSKDVISIFLFEMFLNFVQENS